LDQKDSERALRAVHSRFYLSDVPIGVGIVGPGLIGATLLDQLREQVGWVIVINPLSISMLQM
jgi:aspartokinase/homoserine dehydrogenase 1